MVDEQYFEDCEYGAWVKQHYKDYKNDDTDVIKSIISDTQYSIDEAEERIIDYRCKIQALNLILLEKETNQGKGD